MYHTHSSKYLGIGRDIMSNLNNVEALKEIISPLGSPRSSLNREGAGTPVITSLPASPTDEAAPRPTSGGIFFDKPPFDLEDEDFYQKLMQKLHFSAAGSYFHDTELPFFSYSSYAQNDLFSLHICSG